nr:uncharacterized protein LOC128684178 [Cherax quadricarinatus]
MPRIMDVVVSFLPSPDSGSISVLLIVPSMKTRHTVDTSSVTHQVLERQFSFTCGMDVTHRYTMLSCKLKTPSVHEKVFVRYQVSHDPECKSFRASLGIFNHTYYTKETACYSPLILQATLSKNSQGGFKDELALKFGLVDVRTAEIDLLGTIHVKLQLYPPFLLHAMAYTATSMWSRWRDIMHQAQDEINTLTLSAKTVVQAVAADVIVKADLPQVSISTPASFLADYLQGQTHHLLLEMKEDQLLLDIAHGAQACCDVTG